MTRQYSIDVRVDSKASPAQRARQEAVVKAVAKALGAALGGQVVAFSDSFFSNETLIDTRKPSGKVKR